MWSCCQGTMLIHTTAAWLLLQSRHSVGGLEPGVQSDVHEQMLQDSPNTALAVRQV